MLTVVRGSVGTGVCANLVESVHRRERSKECTYVEYGRTTHYRCNYTKVTGDDNVGSERYGRHEGKEESRKYT